MSPMAKTEMSPKVSALFDAFRRMALTFPGVEEGVSYGTPALKVRSRLLARLHQDARWLVLRIESFDERDMLMERDPNVFFITDHYKHYPMMLANLETATLPMLRPLFEQAWRDHAPKTLRTAHDKPGQR
jgi:hypothetical protein